MGIKRQVLTGCFIFAIAGMAQVGDALAQQRMGQCASEGGSCFMPSGGQGFNNLIFANGAPASVRKVEGVYQVPCSTTFIDPTPGQGPKQCFAEALQISDVGQFQQVCSEGQSCRVNLQGQNSVGPNWFREARFGVPGKWAYWFVPSDFDCNIPTAGFDPAPGIAKVCQLSEKIYKFGSNTGKLDDWAYCSGENSTCHLNGGRNLIAFGVRDQWFIREVEGNAFQCNLSTFGRDPFAGQSKQCLTKPYPLERKVLDVDGKWVMLNSCGGSSCTFRATYTVGQSKTDQSFTSESWSKQVVDTFKTKLEIEGKVMGATVKSTTDLERQTTTDEAVTKETMNSLTRTQSEAKSVSCKGYALFQWYTTVQQSCVSNNLCPAVEGRTPYLYCNAESTNQPPPLWKKR
jgi:hypothetical protein